MHSDDGQERRQDDFGRQIDTANGGTTCQHRSEPSLAPHSASPPKVKTQLRDFLARNRNFLALDNKSACIRMGYGSPRMTESATKFQCPNCEAAYKVVRIEAPPDHNNPVLCLSCGGFQNRDGKFANIA